MRMSQQSCGCCPHTVVNLFFSKAYQESLTRERRRRIERAGKGGVDKSTLLGKKLKARRADKVGGSKKRRKKDATNRKG